MLRLQSRLAGMSRRYAKTIAAASYYLTRQPCLICSSLLSSSSPLLVWGR